MLMTLKNILSKRGEAEKDICVWLHFHEVLQQVKVNPLCQGSIQQLLEKGLELNAGLGGTLGAGWWQE